MFKKIMIGNDHGGVEAKQHILRYLQQTGYEVINIGSDTEEIVRYPYYAARVATAVSSGEVDGGILICSTGIGMSIIANKFKGVRASLCTSHYMAQMTRRHNNSNVLCLGGKITGQFEMEDILSAWLESEYEGGRHAISLAMIADAEDSMLADNWQPSEGPAPKA
ncbi:MAG TPA: ribose 5-phosphate isomerase B [Feifaniaceae bacterium]|nr:ribose 5-phosphate isomerase B [Feifaniaceae bacterium]